MTLKDNSIGTRVKSYLPLVRIAYSQGAGNAQKRTSELSYHYRIFDTSTLKLEKSSMMFDLLIFKMTY